MKNTVLTVMLSLAFIGTGCLTNEQVEPEIIIEPVALIPVSRDSITVGGHLGIKIDTDAEDVYETLKSLPEGSGIRYVNVVGNIFSNAT
jgi:hypothetical protein